MEQSETPDILRSVQPTRRHTSSPITPQPTPRLPNYEPAPTSPSIQDPSDSVLSLRFPRPVGNRQLTNWISSSSPDIMQPGNIVDDDASLSELGYDVIGTDGESQAESTTSSLDYQRADDVQSLISTDTGTDTGTDVDTDSSDDDEDNNLHDTTISDATVVEEVHYDASSEPETLNMVNRSLENPTNLSLSAFSPFTPASYLDRIQPHDPAAVLRGRIPTTEGLSLAEQASWAGPLTVKELENSEPYLLKTPHNYGVFQSALRNRRRVLAVIPGLILIYVMSLVAKSLFFTPSAPRELSTVPVASVSIAVPSSLSKPTYSVASLPPKVSQTPNAPQSSNYSNSLLFNPFGKDNTQPDVAAIPLPKTICSAELSSRDEIMITIPQNLKSSWLARDAILIAVSRGLQDIPTKVSLIDEGFLIQVPSKQANGVLAVTIATTHKPRIHESFNVDFGTHLFTEAFDAGKQLVCGFAQRVVDTVNGTTTWVGETYIPALDVVSKQVYSQTASVSGSVLHGLRDVSETIINTPGRLIAQIRHAIDIRPLLQRAGQLQLELARQSEDVRDDLRMALLKSQLASKLMWLRLKGKTEEHTQYVSKAKIYWKEQCARVETARVERAERTKQRIQAWRERGPFFSRNTGGA
ncbi:hypothetical protein GGR50DRAFT_693804 [Xylaria sp. CBS 124048]|nr:hypothetical protein GGR50DRAFT_693804 [Xylaria sp. CBS 124048]